MTERFDKAWSDLMVLRQLIRELVGETASGELASVVPGVDAAFKSEVLEQRIRLACRKQALHERIDSDAALNKTETGRHFWDFDWWLTEATLRALHAGSDALAQLLNLVFNLGQKADSARLAADVVSALKREERYAALGKSFEDFRKSEPHKALGAFVNYVKHHGFPRRLMDQEAGADGVSRVTAVGRFIYRRKAYGAWAPEALDALVDDFREGYLGVLRAAATLRDEG